MIVRGQSAGGRRAFRPTTRGGCTPGDVAAERVPFAELRAAPLLLVSLAAALVCAVGRAGFLAGPAPLSLGSGANQVWVLGPTARFRAIVVFGHGWSTPMPGDAFAAWIAHLRSRGNLVIYPRYRESVADDSSSALLAFQAGVVAALRHLEPIRSQSSRSASRLEQAPCSTTPPRLRPGECRAPRPSSASSLPFRSTHYQAPRSRETPMSESSSVTKTLRQGAEAPTRSGVGLSRIRVRASPTRSSTQGLDSRLTMIPHSAPTRSPGPSSGNPSTR